jgi:hypothetical protein
MQAIGNLGKPVCEANRWQILVRRLPVEQKPHGADLELLDVAFKVFDLSFRY